MIFKQMSDAKGAGRPRRAETDRLKQVLQEVLEADRPWEADIDRLRRTIQEMLAAISNLTGVELAGEAVSSDASDASHPLMGHKSLKDRIRNDLESFATMTASEMAREAERKTHIALAALQSEANAQAEQAARDLRERFRSQFETGLFEIALTQQTQDRITELAQGSAGEFARWVWLMCKGTGASIPQEVERLLKPYVEDTTDQLLESVRRQFSEKLEEQEQLAQERLKGLLRSLEERTGEFGHAAKRTRDQNVEMVAGELVEDQKPLPKDERLEARVTSEQKRLIEHAAEIRGTSMTDLMVAAALDAAAKVIKDHDILVLNDGASREFARALLNPPAPSVRAKEAWRRYRKHVDAR